MLLLSLLSLFLGCASEPKACLTALDVRKGNLVVAVSQGKGCTEPAVLKELVVQDAGTHELLWKISHSAGSTVNNAAGQAQGVVQYGNPPVGFEASGPKPQLKGGMKLEVLVQTAGGADRLEATMPEY